MTTYPLQVVQYTESTIKEWDSLVECARFHHTSTEHIKQLIMSGGTLYSNYTFDISLYCDMDIKEVNGKLVIYNAKKRIPRVREARRVYHACHQGSLCLPDGVAI